MKDGNKTDILWGGHQWKWREHKEGVNEGKYGGCILFSI
jgi:hypothetical protein